LLNMAELLKCCPETNTAIDSVVQEYFIKVCIGSAKENAGRADLTSTCLGHTLPRPQDVK
jgi:hypothetical protein